MWNSGLDVEAITTASPTAPVTTDRWGNRPKLASAATVVAASKRLVNNDEKKAAEEESRLAKSEQKEAKEGFEQEDALDDGHLDPETME